ncbi:MAG: hypothetical protein H7831_15065 [Magnetococcus sp. WYHC-3]
MSHLFALPCRDLCTSFPAAPLPRWARCALRPVALLSLTLLLSWPAALPADDDIPLRRFFSTAEERVVLDRLRNTMGEEQHNQNPDQDAARAAQMRRELERKTRREVPSRRLTVKGFVRRNQGSQGVVWMNDYSNLREPFALEGVDLDPSASHRDAVVVKVTLDPALQTALEPPVNTDAPLPDDSAPAAKTFSLRSGQVLDLDTGDVWEGYRAPPARARTVSVETPASPPAQGGVPGGNTALPPTAPAGSTAQANLPPELRQALASNPVTTAAALRQSGMPLPTNLPGMPSTPGGGTP